MKLMLVVGLALGLVPPIWASDVKTMNLTEFFQAEESFELSDLQEVQVNSNQADAESLALLAERLFYTGGFIYVNEVADQALKLDPNNKRAKLYKAFGNWIDLSRGLLKRVTPLARTVGYRALQGLAELRDSMPAGMRQFFLDGIEDIQTTEELQDFFLANRFAIQKIGDALEELGDDLFVMTHYSLEVRYRYFDYWTQTWYWYTDIYSGPHWGNCPVSRIAPGVFVFEPCTWNGWDGRHYPYPPPSSDIQVRLLRQQLITDRLDIEALKGVVNGMNIASSLLLSTYSLAGLENITSKLSSGIPATNEELHHLFQEQPKFLTLRDREWLSQIRLQGQEFLDALEWYQQNFSQLCGSESGELRQGHFFGPQICFLKDLNKIMLTADQALRGSFPYEKSRLDWSEWPPVHRHYNTRIDFIPFLQGQITDLRALLPNRFNSCGQSIGLPDESLGGVFPLGDFIEFKRFDDPNFLRPVCR